MKLLQCAQFGECAFCGDIVPANEKYPIFAELTVSPFKFLFFAQRERYSQTTISLLCQAPAKYGLMFIAYNK